MKSSTKNNLFFSVILLICMFALTLLRINLFNTTASNTLGAVYFTIYFVVFPCLSGVMLKVVVNNVKSALIITSLCMVIWSVGDAVFRGNRFFSELLLKVIIIQIIMFLYFIVFTIIKSEKKVFSIILISISFLILVLVFWGGQLLFLELAR